VYVRTISCRLAHLALAAVVMASCDSPTESEPPPDENWEPPVSLRQVIWTGEQFVVVGQRIMTSPDGTDWKIVYPTRSFSTMIHDIVYADGRYTAIGEQYVAVSDDLVDWTLKWWCDDYRKLTTIICSPDKYLISGYNPRFGCPFGPCPTVDPFVLHSEDGDVWNGKVISSNTYFGGAVWADSQFVAMTSRTVLTSPDGVTWTSDSTNVFTKGELFWTGKEVICIAGLGQSTIYSLDGPTWTERGAVGFGSALILADTLYVAVGLNGDIFSSTDLDTWVNRYSAPGWPLYDVAWSGELFVAVGLGIMVTSPDGVTWTRREII
jgi:hypothetical protein